MDVIASSTLTVFHDGQFWIGICEHMDEGRYGACRIVFGATEPTDTELLAFVCTLGLLCRSGSLRVRAFRRHPMRTQSVASARRANRWSMRASGRRPSRP